jgi:hypothetical protein
MSISTRVKAQSSMYTNKTLIIIFLHINARKCSWNLFNHCQTIIMLNIEFIGCCMQSLKKINVLKVGQSMFEID